VVKQERAERTRETIIRAAASIFEQDGFAAAQLSGIVRQATVTKGALYFHFASKRELARAVVGEAAGTLQILLGEARRHRGGQLPLQILIDLSHTVAGRLTADPVLRAGLRLGTDADLFPEHGELIVDWGALVDELLRKPTGELAEHVQSSAWFSPLAAVLTGLELLIRRQPERVEPETLTSVWRLLLPGLARSDDGERYEPAGSVRRSGPVSPMSRQSTQGTRQHTDPPVR